MTELVAFMCARAELEAIGAMAARGAFTSPQDVIAVALHRFAKHLDLVIPINLFAIGRQVR